MEHGGGGADWLHWLQDGVVGQAMRQSALLYPAVEILHIVGFALLVGSIAAVDLRLLGAGRWLPADDLARYLLPLAIGGFALALPTGVLLLTSEAVSIAASPAFLVKLALIAAAGANAAVLHLGPRRDVAGWGELAPPRARVSAGLSLLFWLGALSCGRLIAYF